MSDGVKPGFEIKPFSPVNFAKKLVTIQKVFWPLSGYKELNTSRPDADVRFQASAESKRFLV